MTLHQRTIWSERKLKRNNRSLHPVKGQCEANLNSKETIGHYITIHHIKGQCEANLNSKETMGHYITSKGNVKRT